MPNDNDNKYSSNLKLISWVCFSLCAFTLIYFYGFIDCYAQASQSAFFWLGNAWNPETDYEHGWMVPLLASFLLIHTWRENAHTPKAPSLHGLGLLLLGCLMALLAVRAQQARLAIAALPLILLALIWCYWGGRMAWRCCFPCLFLWLCIPLPGLQQATVGLQLIATDLAQALAQLSGVETLAEGNCISSASGQWDKWTVAGGCSGIRSLMALFMFSTAWAYLAPSLRLWKRILLALAAIPLAILSNGLRVASIIIIAEYINPAFALGLWHDWSGLLLFFPACLLGLFLLQGLLSGQSPALSRRREIIHRNSGDTAP